MTAVTPEQYLASEARMDRPIPGMSLTNDPNNPAPYEQPPKFTNVHEANNYLWEFITSEQAYVNLMDALSQGVPVMKIVEVILFNEFQKGSFNPDLMLMLAEPLAYMLIALAERLDIDVEIDVKAEEDENDIFGVEVQEKKLEELKQAASDMSMIPQGIITPSMKKEMNTLPEISLLSQAQDDMAGEPVKEEAPSQQPSLMAPPEGQ